MRRTLCLRTHRSERGLTLVELMVTVAILGILSTLAVVGYRKYIDSAKITEAQQMAQSIRGAQEAFRAETMTYFNVSASGSLYPADPDTKPANTKFAWSNPSHSDAGNWQTLGASADGPVRFGYLCNAGAAGGTMTAISVPVTNPPTWPTPTEPWYVIQAKGKTHNDGSPDAVLIGSSLTGELYWQNE